MEKNFETKKLIELAKTSTDELNNHLNNLIALGNDKSLKRSYLILKWVDKYTKYLQDEDNFKSDDLLTYKRGNIVQVNFGYRLGKELGGIHYAVVIDIKNDKYSPIITIVPLSSLKLSYKESRYTAPIAKGVYELLDEKIKNSLSQLLIKQRNVTNEIKNLSSLLDNHNDENTIVDKIKSLIDQLQTVKNDIKIHENYINDFKHMKSGTIALISQLTTISKLRIISPTKKIHSLYSLKLGKEDMDLINQKIKDLYIFNICK